MEPNGMPLSNSSINNQLKGSGFGFHCEKLDRDKLGELGTLAEQILGDPLKLQQLSNRVYRLMQNDLNRQRERQRG